MDCVAWQWPGFQRVLADHQAAPSPIHALYPSARLLPARVRAFLDLAQADGVRAY